MNCPKCKHEHSTKEGFVRGLQRYKCKGCKYLYTVEKKSDVKSLEIRKLALDMYLEGMGFRGIGRVLKISYGTVYQWIKKWGNEVSLPISGGDNATVEMIEMDEMHTLRTAKKTTVGYG
jgi:transposase-like protein